jgi:DNA-binding beta-propeller fold protein YncE
MGRATDNSFNKEAEMEPKRRLMIGGTLLTLLVALGVGQALLARAAAQQGTVQAPRFEVDPFWPKPLPNHWVLGNTIGVWVDDQDVVWTINRGSATLADTEKALELKAGECCAGAPPVLAYDAAGTLVRHWGGPGQGFDWPASNHGIFVDHTGSVWIGGNGPGDSHILKFTKDGKFLMQVGKPAARRGPANAQGQPTFVGGSTDPENFGRVAKIFVDPKANEAYVADGYLNKRVAVIDAATGKMKRFWGAYGNKPDDTEMGRYNPDAPPLKQFRSPVHCADLSSDGFLYVCDRINDRIQVFRPDGTFVKEAFIAKRTLSSGSVWDVAFSKDPQQRYLYLADGINNRIYVLQRDSLELLTSFGDGGRQPGQFYGVHSIAVDSKGNIYTTETWEGKRLQKFVFKGVGRVSPNQGVVWPTRSTQ